MVDFSKFDTVEVDSGRQGGTPVLKGTRLPIGHLIQYWRHGYTLEEYLDEFSVDPKLVKKFLEELRLAFRPNR
jgi:uncharacterized protein (DUF433 family)